MSSWTTRALAMIGLTGAACGSVESDDMRQVACSGGPVDAPLTRDPVTATFRIQSTLDAGEPTSFYVDTLALTVACR